MYRFCTNFFGWWILLFFFTGLTYGQCLVKDPVSGKNTDSPSPVKICVDGSNKTLPFSGTAVIHLSSAEGTIDWGDGSPVEEVSSTTVSHTYKAKGIYTYTFTCTSGTVKGEIWLDYNTIPGFSIAFPSTQNPFCIPSTLQLTNNGDDMTLFNRFRIEWGDGTDTIIDYRSMGKKIPHLYKNARCNVSIKVTYQGDCPPPPGASIPGGSFGPYHFVDKDEAKTQPEPVFLCEPTDITIKDNSVLNCLSSLTREIQWITGAGFNTSVALPSHINNGFVPRTTANRDFRVPRAALIPVPADSTYHYTFIIRNTCGNDTVRGSIRIVAPKEPEFSASSGTCPGTAMEFQNTTPAPSAGTQTFRWDWGDGSALETNNNAKVNHVYKVGGTYTVKLYSVIAASNGRSCEKVSEQTVQVQRTVTPAIKVSPQWGCGTNTVVIKNTSLNTNGAVWKWSLGNSIDGGNGFLPTVPANDPRLTLVSSSADSVVIRYNEVNAYAISLTASSGACKPMTAQENIYVAPTPQIRWRSSAQDICKGDVFTIRDSSFVQDYKLGQEFSHYRNIRWSISWGDGTVDSSAVPVDKDFDIARVTSHVYADSGTFQVVLRISTVYGCISVASRTVKVKPVVAPVFSLEQRSCHPGEVTFINSSKGDADAYLFEITKGGMLIDTIRRTDKKEFTRVLSGSKEAYLVRLITITGKTAGTVCKQESKWKDITIDAAPVVAFSKSTSGGCSGTTPLNNVSFVNNSANYPSGTVFKWKVGEQPEISGFTIPNQRFENTSDTNRTDTIRLSMIIPATSQRAEACTLSAVQTIVVYPAPDFTVNLPKEICSGDSVWFAAQGKVPANYVWNIGGKLVHQQSFGRRFTYTNDQPLVVRVEVTGTSGNGCKKTWVDSIVVQPKPHADIIPDKVSGCSPLTVRFRNGSTKGIKYVWKFLDGSNKVVELGDTSALTHTFYNYSPVEQKYIVRLQAYSASGCVDSTDQLITVAPQIKASIGASVTAGCSPLHVVFSNNSGPGTGHSNWDFGDGVNSGTKSYVPSRAIVFTNTTSHDTTYLVRYSINSQAGCTDTAYLPITVYANPKPSFVIEDDAKVLGEQSNTVRFENTTPNRQNWTFTWDFGDGTRLQDNSRYVFHTYQPGNGEKDVTYKVKLVALGQEHCADSVSMDYKFSAKPPVADFEVNAQGCAPLTVQFKNNSKFGSSYHWNFGDGNTSNEFEPVHVYRRADNYSVTLTVTGAGGTAQEYKKNVVQVHTMPAVMMEIKPSAPRKVRVPTEPIYCYAIIAGEDFTEGYTFEWDFGDGNKSYERNPEHRYREAGEYRVSLKVRTKYGCEVQVTDSAAVIKAEAGGTMVIPNAFTPSLSGPSQQRVDPARPNPGNDIFYPIAEGVVAMKLQVFNRWGEMVFESKEIGYGWDGYYRGLLCKQDVYVYRVEARFSDGSQTTKIGDVTLVR